MFCFTYVELTVNSKLCYKYETSLSDASIPFLGMLKGRGEINYHQSNVLFSQIRILRNKLWSLLGRPVAINIVHIQGYSFPGLKPGHCIPYYSLQPTQFQLQQRRMPWIQYYTFSDYIRFQAAIGNESAEGWRWWWPRCWWCWWWGKEPKGRQQQRMETTITADVRHCK